MEQNGVDSTPLYTRLLTGNDDQFRTHDGPIGHFELYTLNSELWQVSFAPDRAPPYQFHLGRYLALQPGDAIDIREPGLRVQGPGVGCARGEGRFTVLDVGYDPGGYVVERFAANFEEYCSPTRIISGAVRMHSTIPLNAVEPVPTATPTPVPVAIGPLVIPACQADPSLQGQQLYVCMDSSPGDRLGGGRQRRLLPTDPQGLNFFVDTSTYLKGVTIHVDDTQHGTPDFWTFMFRPGPNQSLSSGLYTNMDPIPFVFEPSNYDPSVHRPEPALYVLRDGYPCTSQTGRFEILENVHNEESYLVQFAANFEYHCDGGPPLLGVLRYYSSVPP
jgi:hypothetical protein